jgi:spore cortex protein
MAKGGLKMKKTIFSLSAALLLGGGLVGCTADNNGAVDDNNNTRPIGYYSNEDTRDNDLGINNRDNAEGPMTDIMDRDGNRDNAGNNNLGINNDNNGNNIGMNGGNQTNDNNGQKADQIANRITDMDNVEDARVIISDENVLVGVDTNDNDANDNMESRIRKSVQNMVNGKDVNVTTDEDMYNRIESVDNDLQNGDGFDEVQSDVQGILDDIGNAVQRPFENNR